MEDIINIKNIENINDNNTCKDFNKFENHLKTIEYRLNKINNNLNKFNYLEDMKIILNKNIYVSSFFKNKKFEEFINNDFNQYYNYYKKSVNNFLLLNNDTRQFNNSKDSKNMKNALNNINRTNDINVDLFTKVSSDTLKFTDKGQGIMEEINKKGALFNNNSKVNNNNYIGKKRTLGLNTFNTEKETIYNEIKDLYNSYQRGKYKNNENTNKIYEQKSKKFGNNETIILENNPVCIIYFNEDIIESIYLITNKETIKEDYKIIEVLTQIKKDLINLSEKNKYLNEE